MEELPTAVSPADLQISGEAPNITVKNAFYAAQLDPKSGTIRTIRRAEQDETHSMAFSGLPIHFGVDVWSPPQSWDHDYDWAAPPNQKLIRGPLATRYARWGPLQRCRDVVASITYTFYSQVPYVQVSATLDFTANRSCHAVRIGEIVVEHSHKTKPDPSLPARREVFTHYAWPNGDGHITTREINAIRDEEGVSHVEGSAAGAIGVLDRDVPWVAGYNTKLAYGLASLRKSQFAGNRLGEPVPHTAPCTYVANYGWGFVYWSRPMVYPLGFKGTSLDRNMAIAAGTVFSAEDALFIFQPDESLRCVEEAHKRFTQPLRHCFVGAGPWW
jgi:hypothetical protein